jgi:membrane protease YdiL (CAAX protease family)
MTILDLLCLAVIAAGLLLDHFVLWSAFVRRSRVDPGPARRWIWSAWMGLLWALTACGAAVWLQEQRPFSALGFVVPHGWRLLVAAGLVSLLVVAYGRTLAKLAHVPPAKRIALQKQFGEAVAVLPHTRRELGWFVALSLSAGFCEEFVFRGFLIAALSPMLGLWGAATLSLIVFALAHAYQGKRGIVTTGAIGGLMTLVVLGCQSLLPAMALHALIDVGQGFVAWLVLREIPNVEAER